MRPIRTVRVGSGFVSIFRDGPFTELRFPPGARLSGDPREIHDLAYWLMRAVNEETVPKGGAVLTPSQPPELPRWCDGKVLLNLRRGNCTAHLLSRICPGVTVESDTFRAYCGWLGEPEEHLDLDDLLRMAYRPCQQCWAYRASEIEKGRPDLREVRPAALLLALGEALEFAEMASTNMVVAVLKGRRDEKILGYDGHYLDVFYATHALALLRRRKGWVEHTHHYSSSHWELTEAGAEQLERLRPMQRVAD